MHEMLLSRGAARALERLTPQMRRRIFSALDRTSKDPFGGKRLRGELEGLYSLRVGEMRIVYEVDSERQLIVVHAIGPRGDIYKR